MLFVAGCGDPCSQAQEHLRFCGVTTPMQHCDANSAEYVLSMSCEMMSGEGKAERPGDDHWWCENLGFYCPMGPSPEGAPARYPIILAHGFNAQPGSDASFYKVAEALENDGHQVFETTVPPLGSIKERGAALAAQILELTNQGRTKVNIIAHSMGGLDARAAICHGGVKDLVASVSTISTPHQGTIVVDDLLELLGEPDSTTESVLISLVESFMVLYGDAEALRAGLAELSVDNVQRFNESCADDPAILYQSWAGVTGKQIEVEVPDGSEMGFKKEKITDPDYYAAAEVACQGKMYPKQISSSPHVRMQSLHSAFGQTPNDALVSVDSARWGEFQECIPADHMDEIGQIHEEGTNLTGFNHFRFFRNMAFGLSRRGL